MCPEELVGLKLELGTHQALTLCEKVESWESPSELT